MKTRILFSLIAFLSMSVSQVWSQAFDLSSFSDGIEQTMHKLEIGDKEAELFYDNYKSLSKSLLNLNEEIMGKDVEEVSRLIEKKFDVSKESFKEGLEKEQFIVVQNLLDKQSKLLKEALIGEKGLIGTHGLLDKDGVIGTKGARGNISIVVGTCIK